MGFHYPPKAILDPAANLRLGARYLKQQLDRWGNVYEALLAYNGGAGAVYAYRAGNCYNCAYADSVLALRDRIERREPV
jgi:soluble lytic murein transglycosylase-like protein